LIGKYAASRGEKRGLHCRCDLILNIPGTKRREQRSNMKGLNLKKGAEEIDA
jgi:hypothetical protein